MAVGLAIVTVLAFAELGALEPRTVALAVLLAAHRLLAGTLSSGSPDRDSQELAGVAKVGHHLRLQNLDLVAGLVVAAGTLAGAGALSPIGKTLTVEFEASYFGALAAMMGRDLLGLLIHSAVFDLGGAGGVGTAMLFLEEVVEQVGLGGTGMVHGLYFLGGVEAAVILDGRECGVHN